MANKQIRVVFICIILIILSVVVIFLSMLFGETDLSMSEVINVMDNVLFPHHGLSNDIQLHMNTNILFQLRLPRALLAFAVGSALALTGSVMQAIIRNSLADPYILGISSGASVGATLSIVLGIHTTTVMGVVGTGTLAFLGAMLTSFVVLLFSGGTQNNISKLILVGMIVSSIGNAITNFFVFMSSNSDLVKNVSFWLMGSLNGAKWESLPSIYLLVSSGFVFFMSQYRSLNLMLLGEVESYSLGVNVTTHRRIYLIVIAVLTSAVVGLVGMIGFVGLIVPHITRGLVGSFHQHLLPVVTLFGGFFLVSCDLLAKIMVHHTTLPIGVVTALIGSPLLLFVLLKRGYRFG